MFAINILRFKGVSHTTLVILYLLLLTNSRFGNPKLRFGYFLGISLYNTSVLTILSLFRVIIFRDFFFSLEA